MMPEIKGSLKLVMGSVSNPGTFNGVFVTKKALGMASEIMDYDGGTPANPLRRPGGGVRDN
jgi:hypothetical protein